MWQNERHKVKNELFTIGPFTAHMYGLMIGIGVISAYILVEKRAKKKGLDYDKIFDLMIWCVIGGILGAKLLYYITDLPNIIKNPKLLLNVSEGFVVYGGIILGVIAGYLFSRKNKWNFLEYFDLVMPSIALAQGFGRIGCLFAGCCYGVETTSKIHMIYHTSNFAPLEIAMVPTQLISSILNFAHFLILMWFSKHKKANGQVAALYLVLYSAGRFTIEFFRGDLERGAVGPLSTSQFISIFIFLFGIGLFFYCMKKKKTTQKDTENVEAIESETTEA